MKAKAEQKKPGVRILSMHENQCVWMKAGVVNYKICENAFDCTSCAFDKMISGKSVKKPTALVSWKEVMQQPGLNHQCRHMLTGRVQFKLCSHNFECKDCAYDQLLYDYDQLLGEDDLEFHPAAQLPRSPALGLPMAIITIKGMVGHGLSMEDSSGWVSMISPGNCSGQPTCRCRKSAPN